MSWEMLRTMTDWLRSPSWASAAVTPESNRVLSIEGKLAAPRAAGQTAPGKESAFRTRVLRWE